MLNFLMGGGSDSYLDFPVISAVDAFQPLSSDSSLTQ